MSERLPNPARADIVVLLGTAWLRLRDQNTRWRAVLQEWADDPRVGRLRVVDYPSLSPRNAFRRRAVPLVSWDPRIAAVTGRVALARQPTPLDPLTWRATGSALRRAVPRDSPLRVAIAATPLWAPVLKYIGADRTGFDGVDDWRSLPAVSNVLGHVTAGYRAAAHASSSTCVSPVLAERLRIDFGIRASPIRNGVDLSPYLQNGPVPGGLPDGPFAVYVGVVQQRVDVELLKAAARAMPVVVAGPVDVKVAPQVAAADVTALGLVPATQVPGLLKSASVGLLPHRINALTETMDPMKLREYLAAGLPVVTTMTPAEDLLSPRVFVATQPSEFAAAVSHAATLGTLGSPDPSIRHRTWREVASDLLDAHVGI